MNLKGRICPAYWWFIIIFELFFLWQKNCKFISGWGCKHKYRQKTCPSEIGSHLLQYPSFVCWSRFQVRATTIAMWWNYFWTSIQNNNFIKYFINPRLHANCGPNNATPNKAERTVNKQGNPVMKTGLSCKQYKIFPCSANVP